MFCAVKAKSLVQFIVKIISKDFTVDLILVIDFCGASRTLNCILICGYVVICSLWAWFGYPVRSCLRLLTCWVFILKRDFTFMEYIGIGAWNWKYIDIDGFLILVLEFFLSNNMLSFDVYSNLKKKLLKHNGPSCALLAVFQSVLTCWWQESPTCNLATTINCIRNVRLWLYQVHMWWWITQNDLHDCLIVHRF